MKILSFNIRYKNEWDKDNTWDSRKEMVADVIISSCAEVAGLQEVLFEQLQDLENLLPDYNWVGIGREDGKSKGEYAAVFYLKDRFKVLDSSYFWLSTKTDLPSFGWDAACIRIVTCVKFYDKKNKEEFYFFNTHLDHEGMIAQKESAKLIKSRIEGLSNGIPVILTGDFNADTDSEAYKIITNDNDDSILYDSRNKSHKTPAGPRGTFTNFDITRINNPFTRIDYIFISPDIEVKNYSVLTKTYNDKLPSDHLPILAEVILKKKINQ